MKSPYGGLNVSSQDSHVLPTEPVSVTLYGKGLCKCHYFKDIDITLDCVLTKCTHKCHYQRETGRFYHRTESRRCGDKVRGWSDMRKEQEPKHAGGPQKLDRHGHSCLLEPPEGAACCISLSPARLILASWPPEL